MNEQTHSAKVTWGENIENITEEKKIEIETAITNLINALDNTQVVEILFSKIETNGKENKDESGSTNVGA